MISELGYRLSQFKVVDYTLDYILSITRCTMNKSQWFTSVEDGMRSIKKYEVTTAAKLLVAQKKTYEASNSMIYWREDTPYIKLEYVQYKCRPKEAASQQNTEVVETNQCNAKVKLLKIAEFPKYKISAESSTTKKELKGQLQVALKSTTTCMHKIGCCITFPKVEEHNHPCQNSTQVDRSDDISESHTFVQNPTQVDRSDDISQSHTFVQNPTQVDRNDDISQSHTFVQWFASVEDGMRSIQEYEATIAAKLHVAQKQTYEVSNNFIYWREDTPYIKLEYVQYKCRRKEAASQQSTEVGTNQCNARVKFLKIAEFPEYKMSVESSTTKNEMRKQLQVALKSTTACLHKIGCCITFPKVEEHNHPCQNPTQVDRSDDISQSHTFVQNLSSFDEVQSSVLQFETSSSTKFIKYNSSSNDIAKGPIHWDLSSDTPYINSRSVTLMCQHGKDYNKVRNDMKREAVSRALSDHGISRKNRCSQGSKKFNCSACIRANEVTKFPEFAISTFAASASRRAQKADISERLKHALTDRSNNIKKEVYWSIKFPKSHDHSGHVVQSHSLESDVQTYIERATNLECSNRDAPGPSNVRPTTILKSMRDVRACLDELFNILHHVEDDAFVNDAIARIDAMKADALAIQQSSPGLRIRKDRMKSLKAKRKRGADGKVPCDPLPQKRAKPNTATGSTQKQ